MKKYTYLTRVSILAFFCSSLSAENMYLSGIWEKGKTQAFSNPAAWMTPKGPANRVIQKDDTLIVIDTTGYSRIDGNVKIKHLCLGKFLASKSSIGKIAWSMTKTAPNGKDGSLTIDTNEKDAKISSAISSNFKGYRNDKNQGGLAQQVLTISGGKVVIRNSASGGAVALDMNAEQTPKTPPTYNAGIIFDSPVHFFNSVVVRSNNVAYCEGIGYQVCQLSFLNQTLVAYTAKGKHHFRTFNVFALPTHYFTPLMIINVGDNHHRKARMQTGTFKLSNGSALNVFGTLDINGDFIMERAAKLDIKAGGKVNVSSTNIDKFVEFKSDKLARINIDGALNITNPKLHKDNTKFLDVQMVVGEKGSITVDGTGFQGMNGLYIERSLLQLKKGAKVYARNMLRLGDRSRLQMYGENPISAREPANKLCKIIIQGRETKIETYANQKFDSIDARQSFLFKIGEEVNDISFQKLISKWYKHVFVEIDGFRNGVIRIANDDPNIATNIKAKGWTNFRIENGLLTATKQ